MTANQLRYWELRWKQYYEYYYLQEQKRANRARERETERHNRAQERIDKQELVLKRIEISQNQEKINQQWKKLGIEEQAMIVNAALELRKQNIQADQFLKSQQLAIASLVVQYNNEAEKRQIEKFSAYVKALDVGWTEAAVSKVLTDIESDNTQMSSVLQKMADDYDLDITVTGPKSWSSKAADIVNEANSKKGTDLNDVLAKLPDDKRKIVSKKIVDEGLSYSQAVEKYGPALGLGGKASNPNSTTTNPSTGSSVVTSTDSNGVRSSYVSTPSTATRSSVVYSGGTR